MKFNTAIKTEFLNISKNSGTFIIAEAGVNHGGDMIIAREMIECAAESGVDAVKFQAFKTDHLILPDVVKADYQKKTSPGNETQFAMLKALEITIEQTLELKRYCLQKGVLFLTTPFDDESLNELDQVDLPAYKVASTDVTNLPFLRKVAQRGKPIFLSTGMACLSEVELALNEIHPLNLDVVLMHCTANYPVADNEVNLKVLNTYRETFNILLGYSDHSSGLGAAPYAVPLGASVVEKHFTLDKNMRGPDHKASLDPEELKLFVERIKKVDSFMGCGEKKLTPSEVENRKSLQKCLVASEVIEEGEVFTLSNMVAKRTGGEGISPIHYKSIVGRKARKRYLKNDTILKERL